MLLGARSGRREAALLQHPDRGDVGLRDPRVDRPFLDLVQERPIYAGVAETNIASIRVLEKCGFTAADASAQEHAGELLMRLG